MILSLFVLSSAALSEVPVVPLVETTWIWGKSDESINQEIAIADFPHLSFIRLWKEDDMLIIDRVQKGTNWPSGESFCKRMLPLTIQRFLAIHGLQLGHDINAISVFNAAENLEVGCRCYVYTMMSLGISEINRRIISSTDDRISFCSESDHMSYEIVGIFNVYNNRTSEPVPFSDNPSFLPPSVQYDRYFVNS